MSLPKIIGDRLESRPITFQHTNRAEPLTRAAEQEENHLSVGIKAFPTNTQPVYVGNQNDQSWPLAPGEAVTLNISRQSEVYIRGLRGEGVAILAVRTTGEKRRPYGA